MSGELLADDEPFARLAFRHLEGLATSEEQAELALLLKREQLRLAQFVSLARQHGLLAELLTVPVASPAELESTAAEPPIGGATQVLRRSSRRVRVFHRRRPTAASGWFAAAAALAVVVLGGVFTWASRGEVVGHLHAASMVSARGQAVYAGDQLRSTSGDHLVLRDGSRIGFAAGTRATVVDATRIEVAQGIVMVEAAPRSANEALVITSRLAQARVVGTRFMVTVDTQVTRLDVSEGLVRFTRSADGATLEVPADAWAEVADDAPFVVHRRTADEPAAPAADPFVVGVNLNGGPVTIEGKRWWSQAEAVTHGLVLPDAVQITATAVTPVPAVERAVAGMLNTAIHQQEVALPLSLPLTDGTYDVELWLMENYRPGHRSLTITIEGAVVAERVQDGDPVGRWHRLRYPVTINDGRLDLAIGGPGQQAHLMGFSVKRR